MLKKMKKQAALFMGLVMGLTTFSPVALPAKAASLPHADEQIVTAASEWKYLDDNRDPWRDSDLFKSVAGTSYESALASYRWIWSTPAKPYPIFLGGGNMDVGTNDTNWNVGDNPFGYSNAVLPSEWETLGTSLTGNIAGSSDRVQTYFFRYNFNLQDADWIQSIKYRLQFNDAVILYLNGKEIGRHNTPADGYSQNVSYGAANDSGSFLEASESMPLDPGILQNGSNTLAVALHQATGTSPDAYLNFTDFTLSAEEIALPPEIMNLTIQPGSNETQRNFTWLSSIAENGVLTLKKPGGETRTYHASASQLSRRFRFLTNKVTVTGLEPGVTYEYKVSNGNPADGGIESPAYTFQTAAATDSYSFLLAGDPQIGSSNVTSDSTGWQNTIKRSLAVWPDLKFIVSAGDQVETADTEEHYTGYLAPTEMSSLPVAQTVGNHDNTTNYLGHFNLPNLSNTGATDAGGDYWYTYGKALFMHINSNNSSIASHKSFLQNTIADYKVSHGGAEPAWKILVFHHGLYTSASHTIETHIRELRTEWSPIISELDIDAVLAGHDHVYTRTYMMNGTMMNGVAAGSGTSPITTGYTAKGSNSYAEYSKTKAGETIYITANSASGSKHYALTKTDYPFVAAEDQKNRPTITKIDLTVDSLTFNTYYTDADINVNTPIDTFTLKKPGNAPVKPQPQPTVTGVSISPAKASVVTGKTQQFKASVTGTNNPSQSIIWKVSGNTDSKTTVSSTGLLRISPNEKAKTLTVTAISAADTAKYAAAAVTVKAPTVSNVKVSPAKATVVKGKTKQFKASVTGTNSPAQTVTWKIIGKKNKNTSISKKGLLKIAVNEKAKTIKVRAVSTVNTKKYATATITVKTPTAAPAKKVIPASKKVKKGTKITIKAPKGTTLYYTTNGKTPSAKSKQVKAGKSFKITIKKKTTVKVYAVKRGYAKSKVVSRTYRLK